MVCSTECSQVKNITVWRIDKFQKTFVSSWRFQNATSGNKSATGSSKPTFTTFSSLGPLRSLRGSRAPSCDFASQSSSRCSSGNLTTLSQVLLALRQPDAFGAGEYHNPSAPTTRNSLHPSSDIASQCSLRSGDMHSPLTPAFAGGYRFPMGRDARQAVGMPNPTSPSQPKKQRRF